MEDKKIGENTPNLPDYLAELSKELDSMSLEELREEFELLWADMDEDDYDGELLELYIEAIERKDPELTTRDASALDERFKKLLEGRTTKSARHSRTLKTVIIVAAVVALLVASMAIAQAAGFDLFGRIARWTAETFGFTSVNAADRSADLPPQLKGLQEALTEGGFPDGNLPKYWPEGYEQPRITVTNDPESTKVSGAFGEDKNRIILSYCIFQSEKPEMTYNIDDQSPGLHEHNGIEYRTMTNAGKYLAVWTADNIECRISGVESYEELIKILDSIGD